MSTLSEMLLKDFSAFDAEVARVKLETSLQGATNLMLCASFSQAFSDFPDRIVLKTGSDINVHANRGSDGVWRITGTDHEIQMASHLGVGGYIYDHLFRVSGMTDRDAFNEIAFWTPDTVTERLQAVAPFLPEHVMLASLSNGFQFGTYLGIDMEDHEPDSWIDGVLAAGVDLDKAFGADTRTMTPYLRVLLTRSSFEQVLIERGLVDPNGFEASFPDQGLAATPLEVAVAAQDAELVSLLLSKGVDTNSRSGWLTRTIVDAMSKSAKSQNEILDMLVAHGFGLEIDTLDGALSPGSSRI